MLYAGSTLAASSASTGILGALGPIGAVADMVMLGLGGPSFSKQMASFTAARQAMTSQQITAESQRMQAERISVSNLARRSVGARIPLLQEGKSVSFLSGVGKVFGAVTGIGGVLHEIGSVIHPATTAAGRAATVAVDTAKAVGSTAVRTARAHPVLAAAGAAAAAGGAGMMMAGGTTPQAHLKTVRKALGLHHRRMHVTNTRALHRALRRVKGFERVARRVLQITHHKPVKVHFKFRKHRKAA